MEGGGRLGEGSPSTCPWLYISLSYPREAERGDTVVVQAYPLAYKVIPDTPEHIFSNKRNSTY